MLDENDSAKSHTVSALKQPHPSDPSKSDDFSGSPSIEVIQGAKTLQHMSPASLGATLPTSGSVDFPEPRDAVPRVSPGTRT